MEVIINGKQIPIIIKRKKIKNIYFRIDNNLNFVISAGYFVSEKYIENLIKKEMKSIEKMYNNALDKIEEENIFYLLGEKYNIVFDYKSQGVVKDNFIYFKDENYISKYIIKRSKEVFLSRIEAIKINFVDLPEFTFKVRKMTSRWGVCNFKTNVITLNTELLKKDVSLIDYVIIHEICHFYHHNHSINFWNLVSKHYPYYKLARKMLK